MYSIFAYITGMVTYRFNLSLNKGLLREPYNLICTLQLNVHLNVDFPVFL